MKEEEEEDALEEVKEAEEVENGAKNEVKVAPGTAREEKAKKGRVWLEQTGGVGKVRANLVAATRRVASGVQTAPGQVQCRDDGCRGQSREEARKGQGQIARTSHHEQLVGRMHQLV